jgi:threonine synthase
MSHFQTFCLVCSAGIPDRRAMACPSCGGVLGFRYDYTSVAWDARLPGMWRYWRLLPFAVDDPQQLVTLGEGGTPLLPSRRYGSNVFLKDETRNPTGSHKDRPLSLAINHALSLGATTSFVVSAGSTGISNAAMAARAGLRSVAIMSKGAPPARIYPLFALGSQILEVDGDIDALISQVIEICRAQGLYLSSTSRESNPYQGEGAKTIAFELFEQLGRVPDWIVVPVGGGGTLAAIWRGFQDLHTLGWIDRLPKLVGVQPRAYNALEIAMQRNLQTWNEILALDFSQAAPSVQVKLAHGHPPDGMEALDAVRASGGLFLSVTDEEALDAQLRFSRSEGLYIEPSSGVAPAALDQLLAEGRIRPDETVVMLLCGGGFRENFLTLERRPLQKQIISAMALEDELVRVATSHTQIE